MDTVEQLVGYSLFGIAAVAGLLILLFRTPAKATVLTDGGQRAEKDLRASIILNGVYTNGVKFASASSRKAGGAR